MRTIVSVDTRGAELEYGPTDPSRLEITLIDDKGKPLAGALEARAIRQLADLFGRIGTKFPGAVRGH